MDISFNNVRAEIRRRGWTIEQFCEALGISKRAFYDWEAKKDFPVSYAIKMARMFNTSLEYVLNVHIPYEPEQGA